MEDKYSNKEVARLLRNVSAAYILLDENRFKIIAYEKAGDAVDGLNREIKDIWLEKKLMSIPGIGPSIGQHLDEYFTKGKSKHFDSILKKIPEAVFPLMQVPGIGPKTALKLVKSLHLSNAKTAVEDLKKAAMKNKIAIIETFGKRSQEEIIGAIRQHERYAATKKRMILPYAFSQASEILDYLKKNKSVRRADAMGSLRRMQSTIGDIDIAVTASAESPAGSITKYFTEYPKKVKIDNYGEKKASIIIPSDIRVDLRVEKEKHYGSMLQYFTGSKSHNILLREYALKKGLSLSEYGIRNIKTKKLHEFDSEEKFYNFLGLQYIPAEIRQGTNEIELAAKHQIPELVDLKDIKGDLHVHSSYNLQPSHDLGVNDFSEMENYAKKLGYEYIGFSDHNPKVNLSEKEVVSILKKRKETAMKHKGAGGAHFFIGLEADIDPNGRVALPKDALPYIDYCIVAVHSVFNLDLKKMTERVLKGLEFPKTKILAHPTGRMLNRREGYDLDWPLIFDACKKNGIALEINAWPERLDLPDLLVREALTAGVRLIINSDAHALNQMDNMFYGVSVARRGWATKKDVVNTMNYTEFKAWIE